MVLVVALALAASLVYGGSDFLGALTSRKLTVVKASTIIYAAATLASAAALPLTSWTYSDRAFWAGTLAGVVATVGMITFYAALAMGPMGLIAPLIALIQTSIPVVVSVVKGQSLPPLAWFAVALALFATILISVPSITSADKPATTRITLRGGSLALISGITLGLSVVLLDFAPSNSGVFSAFMDIVVGLVMLIPLVAIRRFRESDNWLHGAPKVLSTVKAERAGVGVLLLSAVSGVLLAVGNILLVIALHSGNLAVVAVLISLYPLATVFLAWAVLKERMSLVQVGGVVLALTAAILLGTG